MSYSLWLIINIPTIIVFVFIALYPFYLHDYKPEKYKGIWSLVGDLFKNRYGTVFVLNAILAGSVRSGFMVFTGNTLVGFAAMTIYLLSFSLIIMWYPFYLKFKKPENYIGYWKMVGEWLGEPRDAFPVRKK